jgi:aryl-alcohol dehydrogenase-like predicted oxidoreductase
MMELRRLGRTNLQVSVLGFGGAEIGQQNIEQKSVDYLLNIALDSGINIIDTAECYGNSEELIGHAVGHRDDVFISTKCGHAEEPNDNWKPETILSGIERSLKRLKRDWLDLIQLHSCPFDLLKRGEVIDVLEKARDEGKVRFIGCSADGQAAKYAIETGRFDTLQTSFNIADQEALTLTFSLAREKDMGIIVKRPLANVVWKHKEKPGNPWLHKYWERIQKLDYGFLDSCVVPLRFALSPAAVSTVLVGSVTPKHLTRNAAYASYGALTAYRFMQIRTRWKKCGGDEWPGVG